MKAGRRFVSIATILGSLAAQLPSQAQTVTGYVDKVFLGGFKYTLIANPFNTTNNTFAGLFSHLPPGARLLKWDVNLMDFTMFTKVPVGSGWSPPSGAVATLHPGEAAFVLLPGGDFTNRFAGEVLQGSLTNKIVKYFNLLGNLLPYSCSITQLQLNPSGSSMIFKWDTAIQDYISYSRCDFGGFGWCPSMPTIGVAEGFFLSTSTPFEWVWKSSGP